MENKIWYFVTTDESNDTDIESIEAVHLTHARKELTGVEIGVFDNERDAAYVAYYAKKAIAEYRLLQKE